MKPTTLTLTSLSLLLAACTGSSGDASAGAKDEVDVNDGDLSVDDHDYEDPHGDRFNPMSLREKSLLDRAELDLVTSDAHASRSLLRVDDLVANPNLSVTEQVADDFVEGWDLWDMTIENIDDDGELETIALGHDASTGEVALLVRDPQGAGYGPVWIANQPALRDLELAAGDLDGDGRQELAVVVTADSTPNLQELVVVDDAEAGFAELRRNTSSRYQRRITTGDLDGDGDAELVDLRVNDDGIWTEQWLEVWDLHPQQGWTLAASRTGTGHAPFVPKEGSHGWETGFGYVTLVTGDFDAGGADELLVCVWEHVNGVLWYTGYDGALAQLGDIEQLGNGGVETFEHTFGSDHGFEVAAIDATYEYGDELVGVWSNADANVTFPGTVVHYDGILDEGGPSQMYRLFDEMSAEGTKGLFAPSVGDDDQDGFDEVQILSRGWETANTAWLRRYEVHSEIDSTTGESNVTDLERTHRNPIALSSPGAPLLASGDVDADATRIRWTGERFLEVADPVPLVVMAAPPTKKGIDQNRDNTGASYTFSTTKGETHEVSYTTSYSWSASVEGGKFLKAGYERSAEREYESNFGSSTYVTEFTSYSGDALNDYVIFHGVLYQRYVYEIVASPELELIGTDFVINVPVSTKQYFWTLDYYNSKVDDDAQLGTDVLAHTIGAPKTYPTRSEFEGLASSGTDVLWWNSEGETVPQGPGVSGHGVVIGEESTTSGSYTYATGEELTGGLDLEIFEGSFTATTTHGESHLWSVTLGQETEYGAEVGGISGGAAYEEWNYVWGLGVHNHVGDDGRAFQVMNYWVTPHGQGYDE